MAASHVVITGTGRAGTTFLVQLLTRLGLDTGFDPHTMEALPAARGAQLGRMALFPIARAGLEMNISSTEAPYIVKTPYLCDWAEGALASSLRIEHAIIPVRRFEAAAASRARVQELTTGNFDGDELVPGGLWDTTKAESQADILRLKFTKLIELLVHHDIPMTFLMFPRLITDPDYVYEKLSFLLKGIDAASFGSAFGRIVRPDWVHQFTPNDR